MYGWLTEQYPDWENTIGKVIDDKNVLFNTSLSPKLSGKTDNFYGVEIDLNEISKTVKTVADYENEKVELQEKVEGIRKYFFCSDGKIRERKRQPQEKVSTENQREERFNKRK